MLQMPWLSLVLGMLRSLYICPVGYFRSSTHLFLNSFGLVKKNLVRRDVVFQKKDSGGFSVVSVKFKVQALLVQWVKRSQEFQGGWISLLTYWLFDRFGIDLPIILESVSLFSLALLSPFYRTVFDAWRPIGLPRDLKFSTCPLTERLSIYPGR